MHIPNNVNTAVQNVALATNNGASIPFSIHLDMNRMIPTQSKGQVNNILHKKPQSSNAVIKCQIKFSKFFLLLVSTDLLQHQWTLIYLLSRWDEKRRLMSISIGSLVTHSLSFLENTLRGQTFNFFIPKQLIKFPGQLFYQGYPRLEHRQVS